MIEHVYDNGGPAFPRPSVQGVRSHEDNEPAVPGMSLSDYFAAAVLTGIYANGRATNASNHDIAGEAYRMAYAMLELRNA